ncbi:hypothetical protein VP01_131g2 [Puccinia sorghi]|uniref:Uncharacterized protein n=1 Tax=Puccinia sorghi TaxID=27349 RepID=A0A0L6VMN2_9BASI|nr:hypothetical protein VP01_131g2 [Puccinia sorghi]
MIWLGVPVAHPLCIIRPNRYLSKATAEGGLTHNSDGIKSGVPFMSPDINTTRIHCYDVRYVRCFNQELNPSPTYKEFMFCCVFSYLSLVVMNPEHESDPQTYLSKFLLVFWFLLTDLSELTPLFIFVFYSKFFLFNFLFDHNLFSLSSDCLMRLATSKANHWIYTIFLLTILSQSSGFLLRISSLLNFLHLTLFTILSSETQKSALIKGLKKGLYYLIWFIDQWYGVYRGKDNLVGKVENKERKIKVHSHKSVSALPLHSHNFIISQTFTASAQPSGYADLMCIHMIPDEGLCNAESLVYLSKECNVWGFKDLLSKMNSGNIFKLSLTGHFVVRTPNCMSKCAHPAPMHTGMYFFLKKVSGKHKRVKRNFRRAWGSLTLPMTAWEVDDDLHHPRTGGNVGILPSHPQTWAIKICNLCL